MKLDDVVNHFLMDVEVRTRNKLTLASYRYRLGVMVRFLEKHCEVVELEKVRVVHLRQYIQHLLTEPLEDYHGRTLISGDTLAVSTIGGYVRVCKSFFSWCYQEELIDENPTARLKAPKPEKRIVPTFTSEHLDKMLAECDQKTEKGFRDYVMILLLLDTGIRISEICSLHLSDIHDTYIKVFGKGRKEREVGLHPEVSKLLWKYIHKYRHPVDENETALFLARGKPMHQSGLKRVLQTIKQKSGLGNIRLSAHVFRHTFSKMYLENGGELFKLSRELGHSDVHITEVYLQGFGSTEARKEHQTFSPISKLELRKKHKRKKE